MSPVDAPADPAESPDSRPRQARARRAARTRWTLGVLVAVGFHLALIGLTRVQVDPRPRQDLINPRVAWVGDTVVLEEDTLQGQQLRIFDGAPLFLPTSQNYAGSRRLGERTRRPGELFASREPILIMPVDRSPPGLVTAPIDQMQPVAALQGFQWPYLARFGRADPVPRVFETRRARIEIRSVETGAIVLQESIAPDAAGSQDVWPDWRPFGLFITVSDSGRLSEPVMLGGGSGSDDVDRFMREHVRRRMRLDLRLGPGSYRIGIGP